MKEWRILIRVLAVVLMLALAAGLTQAQEPEGNIAPGQGGASTYYVAPDGDDANPGTLDQPWRTIQHAADSVAPGDTVYVRGGAYTESVAFSTSGTATAPITFAAYSGETPVVSGDFDLAQGASHLRLRGFTLQNFSIWGVTLEGNNSDVVLSGLNISGGEAAVRFTVGYSEQPPQYGPVSDITLEDSTIRGTEYEAVDCTPGPCDRMTFRRLEIYDSGIGAGFGGDGLSVARGRDILVEDCYIHDNGGDGIDLNSRDRGGNVPGIVVRRNRTVRNHLQGIKLWAGGRMENNVVWGEGINPVVVGIYTSTVEVVNNTIAYNMYDPAYSSRDYSFIAAYPEIGFSPPVSLLLVNNIFAFNTGPQVETTPTGLYLGAGVQLTEHHNLYWSYDGCEVTAEFVAGREDTCFTRAEMTDGTWATFTGQGSGDLAVDPLFVSGWPNVDLHLQADSLAVNAGSAAGAPSNDAESRPRDAHPDIGAYERWIPAAWVYAPLTLRNY